MRRGADDSGAAGLGYLLKERVGRLEAFLEALHHVADGGTSIHAEVVAQLLTTSRPDAGLDRLTPRETQALALMAQGSATPRSRSGSW